jgi:hypothetical protein
MLNQVNRQCYKNVYLHIDRGRKMLKRFLLMMLFGSLLLISVFPVVQPASSSTQSPAEILMGAGALWAANGGTRAAYVDFYDNYVANPNLYIGLEQFANYWSNTKNEDLSVLEGEGFTVDALAAIPENLSQYNLLYLDSYFSCQPADEPAIRSFISNGGGVVIISGTICYLAWNSATLDNQQDLTSVEPWFGAYQYVNTGGNAYVTVANPLGTSLNVGDALTPTSQGSSSPAITNVSSDSQVAATWEDGSTFAFMHEFGQGRVYWQAEDVFPPSTSPPPPPSQPGSASAFLISPSSETLSVNESFTITVNLTNAQDLSAWQVVLKYNGTCLNMTSLWVPDNNVFAGHQVDPLGPINPFYRDSIDGLSSGIIAESLYDNDAVTNENGVLCSANFTALSAGQSLIEIAVKSNPLHDEGSLWYSTWLNSTSLADQNVVGSSCTVFVDPLIGDINGDGRVDIRDVNLVAKAYGSYGPDCSYQDPAPSSNWNPACDLTGPNGVPDGKVDIRDIALVAKNFGQHYS